MHIFNAQIWTGDPARPWAKSITIVNQRVAALDWPLNEGDADARKFHAIDAEGKTVVPGLIDSHLHLLRGGQSLDQLDLSRVASREEFEMEIQRYSDRLPDREWLIATGWSQENWGGKLPDKRWLEATGDRPAVCYRMDMHMAVVNDAVLRLCHPAKDPAGGRVARDERTGEPTGLMVEAAAWQLVNPLIPAANEASRQRHLLAAQRHAHSMGLTAVGSMEYGCEAAAVFGPLRDRLALRCRLTLLDRPLGAEPMDFSFGRAFANDHRLAVIGYKTFIDGTLGSRTARMLADYADDPGNRGLLVEVASNGRLLEWARAVAEIGLSPSMHAIGDEAVRLALDAVEAVDVGVRPRIEHAQQIELSDMARFGGRIASMQPLHKADDCRYVRKRLGERRLGGTFAFRLLLDAGAVLAFGSDWPVVSCDPILGIRAAVTGLTRDNQVFGADQNLTVDEALTAYTASAAFALRMDDAGILREGYLGDLVMFDRDPFAADWVSAPPHVEMTVVSGSIVYDGRSTEARFARAVSA
ncbi:MAG: amidohydrolase [Phycisphaerales bacterium]|nr:amidohydrolase [Phycisphaerales bacterium]MCI0677216.1 amidohydrolase [Phycisphaerales bacterium]